MSANIGIIGCGKMGYALIKGICSGEWEVDSLYACDLDPVRTELFAQEFEAIISSAEELVSQADIVIIGVKPGQVVGILEQTADHWEGSKLLVSIAAGITTATLERALGKPVAVVRVMPNTPCLIGQGAAAVAGGYHASLEQVQLVKAMLDQVGLAVVVDETYMDAVTAVSGSGPAYAFLVVEAMTDAALSLGLSRDLAVSLVMQTLKGSLLMLEHTGEHPAVLKAQVTSPGGTTIAGLRELEAAGLREAFFAAMDKACQRSRELGQQK